MHLSAWAAIALAVTTGCGPSLNLGEPIDAGADSSSDAPLDQALTLDTQVPDIPVEVPRTLPSPEVVLDEPIDVLLGAFSADILFSAAHDVYAVAFTYDGAALLVRVSRSGEILDDRPLRLGATGFLPKIKLVEAAGRVVAAWNGPEGLVGASLELENLSIGPVVGLLDDGECADWRDPLALLANDAEVSLVCAYSTRADDGTRFANYRFLRMTVADDGLVPGPPSELAFEGAGTGAALIIGDEGISALVAHPNERALYVWDGSVTRPLDLEDGGSFPGFGIATSTFGETTWLMWHELGDVDRGIWGVPLERLAVVGRPRLLISSEHGGLAPLVHFGAGGMVAMQNGAGFEGDGSRFEILPYVYSDGEELENHALTFSEPRRGAGGAIAAAYDELGGFLVAVQRREAPLNFQTNPAFELVSGQLRTARDLEPRIIQDRVSATTAPVTACWETGCDIAWRHPENGTQRVRIDTAGNRLERTLLEEEPSCAARSGDTTLLTSADRALLRGVSLTEEGADEVEWPIPEFTEAIRCAPGDEGFLVTTSHQRNSDFRVLAHRTDRRGLPRGEPITILEDERNGDLGSVAYSEGAYLFSIVEALPFSANRTLHVLEPGSTEPRAIGTLDIGRVIRPTRDGGFALIGNNRDQPGRVNVRWVSRDRTVSAQEPLFRGRGRVRLYGVAATSQGIVALLLRDEGVTPEFDSVRARFLLATVDGPYAEVELGDLHFEGVYGLYATGGALRVVYQRAGDRLLSTRLLPMPRRAPE
ncbi:MAG: hypothetical protein AAF938_12745 [Myxococcota bacterium]